MCTYIRTSQHSDIFCVLLQCSLEGKDEEYWFRRRQVFIVLNTSLCESSSLLVKYIECEAVNIYHLVCRSNHLRLQTSVKMSFISHYIITVCWLIQYTESIFNLNFNYSFKGKQMMTENMLSIDLSVKWIYLGEMSNGTVCLPFE